MGRERFDPQNLTLGRLPFRAQGLEVTGWKWTYITTVKQFYLLVSTPSITKLGPAVALQAQGRVSLALIGVSNGSRGFSNVQTVICDALKSG